MMTYAKVLKSFSLSKDVYVIGAMERGVTIYNQQLRAHNLLWAMRQDCDAKSEVVKSIAVVGGGIAGLTAAACAASAFPNADIRIFEKRSDLVPLQQGADHRFIQPKIYNWPDRGSMSASASIPRLNWDQGRASDVTGSILQGFEKIASASKHITVCVGVEHLQVSASARTVEWLGKNTVTEGGFYREASGGGEREKFGKIIIAAGFGIEFAPPGHEAISYWRNEHRSQPVLNGIRESILISGFGDGALTDLCRATIERFRQDRIIEEMFPLDNRPAKLVALKAKLADKGFNLFNALMQDKSQIHRDAKAALARRLRKDTKVYLHIGGKDGANHAMSHIFGETSSFLNRYLTFLLYKCGAFTPLFGKLEDAMVASQLTSKEVVCRHGAKTLQELQALFVEGDRKRIGNRLAKMRLDQAQSPQKIYDALFYPE